LFEVQLLTMDCQDWETIKIRSISKKTAPSRPAHAAGTKALRAVEDDDAPPKAPRSLSAASRAEIVRLRTAMEPKKTQAELNTACSFPPHTIRDIEAGRLTPTPTQLNVLNRVLKTNLKYE
jgi:ribosome-binding protein aMBF1 (putative translation factor)